MSAARPNILFLFTDDQRFDAVAALGNPEVITPNMDRLVEEGTSFTHAAIQGSTVPAVCQPSRAMLMTGRSLYHAPRDTGDFVTLPQHLRQHGYATFGTGKWHNLPPSYARSFTDGAKIFFGGMSNHLEVPVHDFSSSGEYPEDDRYIGKTFSSELFSDAAIDFLRRQDGEQPFFAYVSYTAPHDPRMAPQEYEDLYDPSRIQVPVNFRPVHPFDNGEMTIRDEMLAPFPRTPEIVQEHIAAYYAMITHLDAHMGRVLEALEESGHAENTIIIFGGDNGLAVGQHGLMGKQNMYDHSVRVPLVFHGPGIPASQRSDALCYLLDVFPTICDLVDVPAPASVEGRSLAPILRGGTERLYDSLFFAYMNVQRAVRDDRYKLIEYRTDDGRVTQLFDLAADPLETANLACAPGMENEVKRLRGELRQWQRQVDDPLAVEMPGDV
ncbi:MAG: sulfatase-like hydrolase/transferase [Armatimonadota bacterium]|nr:sulfatase-like hydrolase/transferase [Armatimonadota bacterium]